ncbi:MAG: NAD(P)/FAD-dependent oxidoreductase [Ruminococcaceae bacterium]|nr:NAD(P)/FAD-dependent oxidoreductase [Oscillospiraceae bacterium]
MYDVVIIGGGVVGCATARELSRYQLKTCLVEREEDVCTGTSKANSAIVHAGFDALPGSLKARFNVEGSRMMEQLCHDLDVSYNRCGSLVLCFDEQDISKLELLRQRGVENGVEGLEIIGREKLHAMEPALSPEAAAALYAPTGAIICPFGLTYALAENAAANGVEFRFDTCVERVERVQNGFAVHTNTGVIYSRTVVNAAGVYADDLHNQLCANKITIVPRRGEYCLLDRKDGHLVGHTIFQLPGALGKGVLVSPTVHGNLIIGPTAADQESRESTATTAEGLAAATAMAGRSVANLPMRDVITSFAGLRARITEGADDFVIGESSDGFFEAAGIESPGLTSAPAIGCYLAALVAKKLDAEEKSNFVAVRRGIAPVKDMPFEERKALVEQDAAYGQIICRCEQITEGEIVEAIHRGARSLDGVKRRVRAGMGRCQGGFCAPRVMEILARELGEAYTKLTKSGGESRLLTGETKEVQE